MKARVHLSEMILESSCGKVALADWTLHLAKMLLLGKGCD